MLLDERRHVRLIEAVIFFAANEKSRVFAHAVAQRSDTPTGAP